MVEAAVAICLDTNYLIMDWFVSWPESQPPPRIPRPCPSKAPVGPRSSHQCM